jgi:hypothetical protein
VVVTKSGSAAGLPVPPEAEQAQLHGFLSKSVMIPADLDLAEPVTDEAWAAEQGVLHG